MLLSAGQDGGEEGEATGGASAPLGLLVIVSGLDLLFGLVLVLIEVLVEVLLFKLVLDAVLVEVLVEVFVLVLIEVLLFDLVLDEVLVEVGAGGAWMVLTGLLVEGKEDADWKRSSSEVLD